MNYVKIAEITNNLDRKRIPLNKQEREKITEIGKYPYIGANNIQDYIDDYIFDEKILCIAEDGGSWGFNQKCAFIYDGKCWVNNHAHVLTAKENLILEYLMHYLNFSDLNRHINGATRGKLNQKILNSIEIPLPPLKTQQKITAILDEADKLRRLNKKLIKKYEQLSQSLFLEMFGDPVSNLKGWDSIFLKEGCTKITDGTHDTPQRLKSGIKFITGKHIRPFAIDFDHSDYVTEDVHNIIFKRCNPEFGDILYTNIGVNLGTAAMNHMKFEFSMKNVALIKYKREYFQGRYLEFMLNSLNMRKEIIRIASLGGAQQFLSLNQIRSLRIIMPPIELQELFSTRVNEIEKQKAQAQQTLEQSEELFNSLLQRAFKGNLVKE